MDPPTPIEDLKRLLPLIPVPICVLNRDFRYLAASPKYAGLCDTTFDAMAGKAMLDFCPPDLVANALRDFRALDAGENIAEHEIVFRERSFLVSVNPVYGRRGRAVVAITVALSDISAIENGGMSQTAVIHANPTSNGPIEKRTEIAGDADPSSLLSETPRLRSGHERRRSSDQNATPDSFGRPRSPLGLRIPLRALMQTLAVAEHLSFRHAASALGVSQSSVSARVKELEIELGILLFERNTRGVRLTEAGRQFVERVAVGIDQLDQAVQAANLAASGDLGRLRVGVHGLIPGSFLDNLLMRYRAEHPAISVEMTEGSARDTIMQLRAHRIDVAFLVGKFDLPDCHSRPVWTEPLVAALPSNHRLAGQSGVTWADLEEETFLVRHGGTGPQVYDHIMLRLAGRWPPPTIERLEVERGTLLSIIAQGSGITLLGAATQLFPTAGVVLLPISDEPEPVMFSAVWSPHNRSASLRNLLALANEMGRSPRPN